MITVCKLVNTVSNLGVRVFQLSEIDAVGTTIGSGKVLSKQPLPGLKNLNILLQSWRHFPLNKVLFYSVSRAHIIFELINELCKMLVDSFLCCLRTKMYLK